MCCHLKLVAWQNGCFAFRGSFIDISVSNTPRQELENIRFLSSSLINLTALRKEVGQNCKRCSPNTTQIGVYFGNSHIPYDNLIHHERCKKEADMGAFEIGGTIVLHHSFGPSTTLVEILCRIQALAVESKGRQAQSKERAP